VAISPRNQLLSASFDPKAFLGRPGSGRTIKRYNKDEAIRRSILNKKPSLDWQTSHEQGLAKDGQFDTDVNSQRP
jgi:hypothetical protein